LTGIALFCTLVRQKECLVSRFRLALLSLIALVGLSTACIQAETAIVMNDDGTGTVSLTQALDMVMVKEMLKDFAEGFGEDTSTTATPSFDAKDVDTSKLPKGVKVESYKSGNFEGVKLTAPFDKPENAFEVLNKLSGALSDQTSSLTGMAGGSSGAPSSSPGQFESMTIGKQGDGWKFEAKLATSGIPGELDAESKALVDSLLKDASITLKVKLPGKVADTNADSTSNNEMTWKLPLIVETPKTLTGRTTR
jgi:hypothetical protein